MLRARSQADGYARAVSRTDGWPPFLLVVDVGHVLEVYADFSGQGQGYTQYPDGNRYRITMDDLRDATTRDRLRQIWTDPHALDPSKIAAQVTREVADRLAALGKSFEGQGHEPEAVARFLMRCLFTMFAEDVDLIPHHSFSDMLKRLRGQPEHAAPALKALWQTMDTGGFSAVLTTDLKKFNGGLFKDADAMRVAGAIGRRGAHGPGSSRVDRDFGTNHTEACRMLRCGIAETCLSVARIYRLSTVIRLRSKACPEVRE